jgi:hypothetical protein
MPNGLPAKIIDGYGEGNYLRIGHEGEASVVVHGHPPEEERIIALPYRQRLANSAGSTDMTVDGSATAVQFFVSASQTYNIYIASLSWIIGDGGSPALNKYGALTALTNGVRVDYVTEDLGTFEMHDGIKTNLEAIRFGVDTGAIGTGGDAYLADVSGGGTEKSYLPSVDFRETFGLPYGLRLRKETNDKLVFTVRDDLTGLTTHDIIAYGIRVNGA